MHEKVKKYLETKESEIKRQKNEKLIELGLFEKIYFGEEGYSEENSYYEWDNDKQQCVFYNKKAIEVTDEEYEQILKVSKEESTIQTGANKIATALTIIAWIVFIGGIVAGIALGTVKTHGEYYSHTEFSVSIALTYWSISLISGTLFLGFAEVIKLLSAIKNK